jgi:hypothetical protein
MPSDTTTNDNEHRVWRPSDWLKAAGHPFSRPVLYREIHAGRIDARKHARSTFILTSPRDYFRSLPSQLGPAVRRRKEQTA